MDDDLVEVEVLGVRRHPDDEELVVLLLEPIGELVVPISIGPVEAAAIATAQAGIVPPRPMTHDLLRSVLNTLHTRLTRVEITELSGGIFHAALVLGEEERVDARASDALALAVRMDCPVLCAVDVLAQAGVEAQVTEVPEGSAVESEDEVERFREFLDQVEPEDFDDGGASPAPDAENR
ncbi:bifunctional nuclease family protein [Cellulomonas taurus]|uniref:bifunctional nuclease family protein n=1 Tax=Cellulomonas taurus TaxID=2729175 RepID=UPI00197DDD23|nr:bifunctional nuclease family protein [Cellulomonas taurus]